MWEIIGELPNSFTENNVNFLKLFCVSLYWFLKTKITMHFPLEINLSVTDIIYTEVHTTIK